VGNKKTSSLKKNNDNMIANKIQLYVKKAKNAKEKKKKINNHNKEKRNRN
jgi:hypothetical protein